MKPAALGAVMGLLVLTAAPPEWLRGDAASAHASTATPGVALQSIYYYAYRATRPSTPGRLPALSLPAAVDVLRSDSSPGRQRRRRLAIAKLAGGATLVKDASDTLQLQPTDFQNAVRDLAGDDFDQIRDGLAALGSDATRRDRENAAFAALDQGSVADLQSHPSCATFNADCGDAKLENGIVKINFSFEVMLPFEEVVRATYPRFWHDCDSTFFKDTYAALQKSDHTYPKDATGTATRAPQQPTPVTAPGPERHWVLYEDFTTVVVSFKNLLDITEKFVAPGTYTLTYDLHESINHSSGQLPEPRGIAVDRGFVKIVKQGPSQTLFAGEKTIQFDDPSLNEIALNFIQELCNESMGLGAGAGVCCKPGGH